MTRLKKFEKFLPLTIFLVAFGYYYALSSKIFTWVYTSGDAGDWLTQLRWWQVPHTWGKPLYILMVKGVNLLPFGNDVSKITLLSIVTGAVMVMFTYMIARNITKKTHLGIIAAIVVLGCTIVLSQATVLEQYTVAGALLMAFFYFYQQEKLLWAFVFLGLTTAVHEVGLVFFVLFLVIEFSRIKVFLKYIPVYALFGLVPYFLILGMMVSHSTPKLMAGFLSLESLNSYGGNTTVAAALALTEAPRRLSDMAMILLPALGFALVPIILTFKQPWDTKKKVVIVFFLFILWFYITNLFPSVWKWLAMVIPLLVCMAMVALDKLPNWHKRTVALGATVFCVVNIFAFNANILAHDKPLATEYYQDLQALPDGSCVITPRGGAYGFAIFYAMSKGKDLIPLALGRTDTEKWLAPIHDQGYRDYLWWLKKDYDIVGTNVYEIVKDAMAKGHSVYFATPMTKMWEVAFIYEDNTEGWLYKVTDVVKDPIFPNAKSKGK